jgi:hypothetical protein
VAADQARLDGAEHRSFVSKSTSFDLSRHVVRAADRFFVVQANDRLGFAPLLSHACE